MPNNDRVKVAHFGFEGSGRTLKEAKEDASRQVRQFIDEAREGAYILPLEDAYAIISRRPDGWQYQIISDGVSGTCMMPSGSSRKDVERAVRMHVAQILCSVPDRPLEYLIRNDSDLAEYRTWFKWQVRYREAIDAGCPHEAARAVADGQMCLLKPRPAATPASSESTSVHHDEAASQ